MCKEVAFLHICSWHRGELKKEFLETGEVRELEKTWNTHLPDAVHKIIYILEQHGYEAYAVGGCVRDALLGRQPEDWDITTSAKPEQVKACFRKTIDTGIAHGTVTVIIDKTGYEVTTYRIDGEYTDNRHPDQVAFTDNLRLDLERRDFTINAMAYNPRVGLVDAFGGMEDLEKGIIRCVGDAGMRFDEDALRMLRAVRFAGQLGFVIAGDTLEAIRGRYQNLAYISAERIRVEMDKLLVSPHPDRIRLACETGMTSVFLPEFDAMMTVEQQNPHHIYTVGEHTIQSVKNMYEVIQGAERTFTKQERSILAFTMLLHDIGKPACKTVGEDGCGHFHGHPSVSRDMAKDILKRLTFDNYRRDTICRLVLWHDLRIEPEKSAVRRAASRIGTDIMEYYFMVCHADILAQNPAMHREKLQRLEQVKILYRQIQEEQQALTVAELAVNGTDMLAVGVPSGKPVGEMLQYLLSCVLDEPEKNQKEILLSLVKEKLKEEEECR